VVFSVRMPRALHRRLAAVAQDDDSTVNRAVIVAVRRYVRAWEAKRARASAPGEEPAT
jgi:predicted HicB family RNase H-like nuclease